MTATPQRLLEAAEDLLLEKGHAATTLRDITERADANVAAVSYHYGSKDALLALTYRNALEEVTQIQRERLAELPPEATLEEVVRVWLAPALAEQDPREARLWTLIQRGMAERAPGLLDGLGDISQTVDDHLIQRLAAALPHLSREELYLRHAATLAAVSALQTGGMDLLIEGAPARLGDQLVAWIVGGLQAPAAGT
ncbi:MAG: TetR family transcriptional regulator [Candidatus Nanopelagicales bacterium]|nr:TetR/AcrR family transcriptional regulator [Actinomycetota bacterium]MCB0921227.1 TetR/AcrR family transcriptional regulator [Actinomycetota bacterium]HNE88929.1 TetR family transcriptional regulator [Actinomycetota bacterium]HNO15800.1 TetR family transcriptional regulator [Actinomycetota bacterium]HUM86197.1 TetR family transcriptional regulator [Actinomycetota bacterium]